MLETKVEAHLRKRIRGLGGLCEKIQPVTAGMPDRLVILPGGRLYLVELKQDGKSLRPVQHHWHRLALKRGVQIVVLRGVSEVDKWIEEIR